VCKKFVQILFDHSETLPTHLSVHFFFFVILVLCPSAPLGYFQEV